MNCTNDDAPDGAEPFHDPCSTCAEWQPGSASRTSSGNSRNTEGPGTVNAAEELGRRGPEAGPRSPHHCERPVLPLIALLERAHADVRRCALIVCREGRS